MESLVTRYDKKDEEEVFKVQQQASSGWLGAFGTRASTASAVPIQGLKDNHKKDKEKATPTKRNPNDSPHRSP